MAIDPDTWAMIAAIAGQGAASALGPDSYQERKGFGGANSPENMMTDARGKIGGHLDSLIQEAEKPINIQTRAQTPGGFTGGGLPMDISLSGMDQGFTPLPGLPPRRLSAAPSGTGASADIMARSAARAEQGVDTGRTAVSRGYNKSLGNDNEDGGEGGSKALGLLKAVGSATSLLGPKTIGKALGKLWPGGGDDDKKSPGSGGYEPKDRSPNSNIVSEDPWPQHVGSGPYGEEEQADYERRLGPPLDIHEPTPNVSTSGIWIDDGTGDIYNEQGEIIGNIYE